MNDNGTTSCIYSEDRGYGDLIFLSDARLKADFKKASDKLRPYEEELRNAQNEQRNPRPQTEEEKNLSEKIGQINNLLADRRSERHDRQTYP